MEAGQEEGRVCHDLIWNITYLLNDTQSLFHLKEADQLIM